MLAQLGFAPAESTNVREHYDEQVERIGDLESRGAPAASSHGPARRRIARTVNHRPRERSAGREGDARRDLRPHRPREGSISSDPTPELAARGSGALVLVVLGARVAISGHKQPR